MTDSLSIAVYAFASCVYAAKLATEEIFRYLMKEYSQDLMARTDLFFGDLIKIFILLKYCYFLELYYTTREYCWCLLTKGLKSC